MNESENTTYPNMWNATKSAIQGKLTALHVYIRKEKMPRINDLSFYLKKLERQELIKLLNKREIK